jgi:hypothetical protein
MKIVPKDWAQFQHYKDRCPSWIKLHRALLDDYEFQCLQVASRALAPMLWLLASESMTGEIDATPAKLSFRLRISEQEVIEALKPLIDIGFFVVVQGASNVLADCYQDASLEKRREEIEKEKSRSVARPRGTRLQPDWIPSEDQKRFAKEERPDLDLKTVADSFRDYWVAKAGKEAAKLDWDATWRNWVRNQRAGKPVASNTVVATNWAASAAGVEERGRELGIFPNDPKFNHWQEFKAAVLRAAQEMTH